MKKLLNLKKNNVLGYNLSFPRRACRQAGRRESLPCRQAGTNSGSPTGSGMTECGFVLSKSFSLIETLIACAILIIVCGALLSLSLIISNNIFFTRQRAVATYLAQDYLEKIRQIRDTNLIDSNSKTNWNSLVCDTGSSPPIEVPDISTASATINYSVSSGICYDSLSEPRLFLVSSSDADPLAKETISGVDFVRKISFLESGVDPKITNDTVTKANSIKAKVEVSWFQNGRPRKIEVIELLTNWKQNL